MMPSTPLKSPSSCLRRFARPVLGLAFLLLSVAVHAQNYPHKKISFVIPWPAGGLNDMVGRVISSELQTSLGQPVIVENLVGAGGSIGTTKALQAPADGHTLLLSSQQDLVMAPLTFKSAQYTPGDAKTVAMLGYSTYMLVVRPTLPVKTLPDLVALLKSSGDKPLSYCSPGIGSVFQLVVERMGRQLQTKALHVPYPGFPKCVTDMMGGIIDFAVFPIGGPYPDFVTSGKLRALAVLSDKPSARFPELPLASATKGFEGMNYSAWLAIHVNPAVPDAIVEQLNKAVLAALAKPDVRKIFAATGGSIYNPMTPQQAHAYYIKNAMQLDDMVRESGVAKQ